MQNRKLLIVLVLTLLFIVPISSHAFEVVIDDNDPNNALGIRNLDLGGPLPYNVDFLFISANDLYGVPPNFDFTGSNKEEKIVAAAAAVNAAFNSVPTVWTVGPQQSGIYNIGADEERLFSDDVTVAYASAYNDRTPLEWDVAKDSVGFLGVNLILPFKSDTYAKFTVVPIPAAVWLLGGGLISLLGLRRRFKN